jgi:hypothetical protein
MAIKIGGTTVINDSRGLENISNLKTVNGNSILGSGDISIESGGVGGKHIGLWSPSGNSAMVPNATGMPSVLSLGTPTLRAIDTMTMLTRARRLGYVSGSTSNSLAGNYHDVGSIMLGTGTGIGGFVYSCRFAASDPTTINSGINMFVGLIATNTTVANTNPAALTNCIGLAQLSSSTNELHIVYGGTTAQTPISLGANFPVFSNGAVRSINGILYEFTLTSKSSEVGIIYYQLKRLGTSFVANGTLMPITIGVQTPSNNLLLRHRAWRSNQQGADSVGIDIGNIYVETAF